MLFVHDQSSLIDPYDQVDSKIPTLIVVNGNLYQRNPYSASGILPIEPNLPGSVQAASNSPSFGRKMKLKMKWQRVSRILQAVTSFHIGQHAARYHRPRSFSDPELDHKTREFDEMYHLNPDHVRKYNSL